jgi:hypothetical protein
MKRVRTVPSKKKEFIIWKELVLQSFSPWSRWPIDCSVFRPISRIRRNFSSVGHAIKNSRLRLSPHGKEAMTLVIDGDGKQTYTTFGCFCMA